MPRKTSLPIPEAIERFRTWQQRERWDAEQQGNLLAVACSGGPAYAPAAKRGIVQGFSRQARLRMLKLLARVDWEQIGKSPFATLTYPDAVKDAAYPDRTKQRSRLFRAVEEHLGKKVPALWRVEWKARKSGACKGEIAPHMHVAFLGARYIDWRWLRRTWAGLLGLEVVVTDIRCREGRRAAAYAAKYAAKAEDLGSLDYNTYLNGMAPGRQWGCTRQDLLPWKPQEYHSGLTDVQIERALQLAGTVLGKKTRSGYLILGKTSELNIRFIIDGGTFPLTDKGGRKYAKQT